MSGCAAPPEGSWAGGPRRIRQASLDKGGDAEGWADARGRKRGASEASSGEHRASLACGEEGS